MPKYCGSRFTALWRVQSFKNVIVNNMNYKEQDRERIINYIKQHGGRCAVADIMQHSGAEKLRVHTILFEECMAGRMEAVEEGPFGSPRVVRLVEA